MWRSRSLVAKDSCETTFKFQPLIFTKYIEEIKFLLNKNVQQKIWEFASRFSFIFFHHYLAFFPTMDGEHITFRLTSKLLGSLNTRARVIFNYLVIIQNSLVFEFQPDFSYGSVVWWRAFDFKISRWKRGPWWLRWSASTVLQVLKVELLQLLFSLDCYIKSKVTAGTRSNVIFPTVSKLTWTGSPDQVETSKH